MPFERPKQNKIRILLCDDHAIVREGTRRLLEEEPDMVVVGEASDGLEAVEMVKELSPDVVAMDVSMPRMNGVEATRLIKELSPSCAVLVLTAYDDTAYVARLIENGASGYILKSARSEELVQAIRATYLGESVLDARLMKEVFMQIARRNAREEQFPQGSEEAYPREKTSSHEAAENNEPGLTEKEIKVLKLLANGLSNKEIAMKLELSPRTVQAHLASVFSKLNVTSRTGAVVLALKRGLISEKDIEVNNFE